MQEDPKTTNCRRKKGGRGEVSIEVHREGRCHGGKLPYLGNWPLRNPNLSFKRGEEPNTQSKNRRIKPYRNKPQ